MWTLESLQRLGISKTIYSYIFPQTRKVYTDLDLNFVQGLLEKPIWGNQDKIEGEFLELYSDFVKLHSGLDVYSYKHFYPTAGSSEAIRSFIMAQAIKQSVFHVFYGEYEGYTAFAEAVGAQVVYHNRERWQDIVLPSNSVWLMSNPSAIDGYVWPDCNDFLAKIHQQGAIIALDICYVGASSEYLDVDFGPVDVVFFSLSKVFGIYYHRVGGMLSQIPQPALYGNRWFKNIPSLHYAMQLIRSAKTNGNFAQQLRENLDQNSMIQYINQTLSIQVKPSGIFYIGNFSNHDNPELSKLLSRNNTTVQTRLCYSSLVDNFLLRQPNG